MRSYKVLMWIGCIISVIILLASIFNCRIPFSLLNKTETESFNHIIEALAIGYLSGVCVFIMTVLFKNKINRRRFKWFVYDLFMKFSETKAYVEGELGVRTLDFNLFKEYYTIEVNEKFIELLEKALNEAKPFEDLLTDKESKIIADIRTNIALEAPTPDMRNETITLNYNRFLSICKGIDKLSNGIIRMVQK